MSFINLQLRRANAATWAGLNLASGEIGLETDTSKFKINYSATSQPWSAVSYVSTGGGGGGGPIDIGGPYGQHLYTGQTAPDIADFPNAVVNDIYLNTSTNEPYVTKNTNYTTPTPVSLFTAAGSLITSIIKVTDFLFLVDNGRNNILVYDITAQTTDLFAGASDGSPGYINDTGIAARFQSPTSIVYDGTDFYVSDTGNNCIRKITASGTVSLLVGLATKLTPDPSDDPNAPFVGILSDFGIQNLPPSSDDSLTGAFLGDVSAPQWMVWANNKIYFTEYGNTKIRSCDPSTIVVVSGPDTVPPTEGFDGTYTSPLLSTVVAAVTAGGISPTSLGQMTFDGTSTIYVGGGTTLFSVNVSDQAMNVIYTLPSTSNDGYTLYYYGWHYKSGVLYYTVADQTNTVMYIYSLNIQSAPTRSLIRQLNGYGSIRAIFVNTDSLNTIYTNIDSYLFKIPAGLAFALIPERSQIPQTENFVVAGGSGTTKLSYSYDGLRWQASPTPSVISYRVLSIAFNGSIWVAGGDNDGDADNMTTLAYSSDGINWTASASGSSLITGMVKAVVWTGSVWVAGGNGTNTLAYSYDGINWLAQPTQPGTAVHSLYWTGSVLLAGNNGNGLAYSYDGIVFKSTGATADYFDISNPSWPLCYAQSSTLIVAGCHDSIAMSWSYDGFSWNTSSTGTALFSYVNGLGFNGSIWVAAGDGANYLAYSLDGKAWTASQSGNTLLATSVPGQKVIWNGNIWIVSAGSGATKKSVYSYDGIKWAPLESANSLSTNNVLALCNRNVSATNSTNTLQTENFMVAGGNGGGGEGNNRLVFSYDGINWNSSPSGKNLFPGPSSTDYCSALEWNGSLWVAGGAGTTNRLGYSTDGKTWFASASGNSAIPYACNCIKWNGTLWVAAGGDDTNYNAIAYSYDGINWTALANPSNMVMISYTLEYNGSMWLIGGNGDGGASISYSYDGISWFPVLGSGDIMYTVRAIKWNGTMFVAGGNGVGASGINTLAYSYDGINWTASPSSNTIIPTQTNAVAWNGKIWVCGGTGTTGAGNTGTDTMAYSYDGITWTAIDTNTLTYIITSIAWNGNIWVAGSGSDYLSIIIYSYDGIEWFQAKTGYSPFSGQCLALHSRKVDNYKTPTPVQTENFMVAGGLQAMIAYTYDGLNWLSSPSGKTVFTVVCLALEWNGSLWVAGGIGSSGSLAYSVDGIVWASVTDSNSLSGTVNCLKWNGSMWLAGTYETNRILYSYDGIIWHAATSANTLCTVVKALEWNGNMWLAGVEGTAKILYSYDGLLWKAVINAPVFTSAALSIAWNGIIWVAGGDNTGTNTRISYSYDGLTWTNSTSGTDLITSVVNGISWNGSQWLAVGYGTNYIAYSQDGIIWNAASSANSIYTDGVWAAKWNGILWVATGTGSSSLSYSYDGINWAKSDSGNNCLGTDSLCVQSRKVNQSPKTDKTITENFMVAGAIQTDAPAPQTLLYYSYDGLRWQASQSNIFDYGDNCSIKKIEWNGSVWIAIGLSNSSPTVFYSQDGIDWSISTSATDLVGGASALGAEAVKWANNLWLIGTPSTTTPFIQSRDGINWTGVFSDIFGDGAYVIETDGRTWVAGGYGSYGYSNDGLTWYPLTTTFPSGIISSLLWNGKIWVAGFVTGAIFYSKDGIVWTEAADVAPYTGLAGFAGGQVLSITYNESTWVAVGQQTNGAASAASSTDGINWSELNSWGIPNDGQLKTVEWNGSFFSAYGITRGGASNPTYGVISYDGTNWHLNKGQITFISTLKSRRLTSPNVEPPVLTENFMVAGGVEATIAYTYDGLNWLSSPSGKTAFSDACVAVGWSGSIWVAGGAGSNGSLAYSVDGINWKSVTGSNGLTTAVRCVKWNGSMWLAGAYDINRILYSYDGISWQGTTSANALCTDVKTLEWDGTMWLAGVEGTAKILYSYDGLLWNAVLNAPAFAGVTNSIVWNGKMWLAGGDNAGSNTRISYSYDGITWTNSTSGTSVITSIVNGISWNGAQWLAVGQGTNFIAYSQDGINWTAATSANTIYTGAVWAAKWNGLLWVATGDGGCSLAYSYDGIKWVKSYSGNRCLTVDSYCVASRIVNLPPKTITTLSENFMVAASYSLNPPDKQTMMYYSYDGLTWHGSQSANSLFDFTNPSNISQIEWNGSLWVAVGLSDGGSVINYSTDGINWSQCDQATINSLMGGSPSLRTVKWGKNVWVAGGTGTNPLIYSYDGITWVASATAAAIFTSGVITIATNGNLFIASATGVFAYSNDGISWVSASDPFSGEPITNISWNGHIWVVGVNGARIHYSTDGLSWTEAPATGAYAAAGSLYGVDAFSIAFNNSVWVAVGCHSASVLRIAYSYDGINWLSDNMTFNLTGTFVTGDIVEWNGSFFSLYGQGGGGVYFGAKSYDGKNWYPITISPTTFITQLKSRKLSPAFNRSLDDLVFLTPANDGPVTIDCNASTKFWITPDGTNALSFINLPAVNTRVTTIEITVYGSSVNVITWPGSILFTTPTSFIYIVQLRYNPAACPAGTAGVWLGSVIWTD